MKLTTKTNQKKDWEKEFHEKYDPWLGAAGLCYINHGGSEFKGEIIQDFFKRVLEAERKEMFKEIDDLIVKRYEAYVNTRLDDRKKAHEELYELRKDLDNLIEGKNV